MWSVCFFLSKNDFLVICSTFAGTHICSERGKKSNETESLDVFLWFVCSFSIFIYVLIYCLCAYAFRLGLKETCMSPRVIAHTVLLWQNMVTWNVTGQALFYPYPSALLSPSLSLLLILIRTHVLLQAFDFEFFAPSLIFNWNNDEPIMGMVRGVQYHMSCCKCVKSISMFHSTRYINLFAVGFFSIVVAAAAYCLVNRKTIRIGSHHRI